jgi:hypothetical protein
MMHKKEIKIFMSPTHKDDPGFWYNQLWKELKAKLWDRASNAGIPTVHKAPLLCRSLVAGVVGFHLKKGTSQGIIFLISSYKIYF